MGRRRRPAEHHGILLIDKPSGHTSHDVVARVRRIFGQRQVGHTGTLDPMATGLMILTLGKATRLGRYVEATHKLYEGTVTLGRSTTTYDAEGETVDEVEVPPDLGAAIAAAAAGLRGTLEQEVPAYSAVKVDGERLYAKARRDEVVELPRRTVTVHELEILDVDGPHIRLRTRVSKGTYIRTLAVQIGAALGLPAHLSALRRTGVGPFSIDDATGLDDPELGPSRLIRPEVAIDFLPALVVAPEAVHFVGFGRPLTVGQVRGIGDFAAGSPVRVLHPDGTLLAVAEATMSAAESTTRPDLDPVLRYACVLVDRPEPQP